MKILILAPAVALLSLTGAGAAGAAPAGSSYAPPYIDHTEWVSWGQATSLRVYPTPAGRAAARTSDAAAADQAWAEVLARSPDADTPGMRAQFVCHWQFAEIARPGKISWNLEPWRPVVDDAAMVAAACNPGGQEEPF